MKASDEIFEKKQNLVHEILRTRREMGMTQKNIEAACGVKQPVIARMERGLTDPQLTTILKVLRPLGKTLKIVDIEEDSDKITSHQNASVKVAFFVNVIFVIILTK